MAGKSFQGGIGFSLRPEQHIFLFLLVLFVFVFNVLVAEGVILKQRSCYSSIAPCAKTRQTQKASTLKNVKHVKCPDVIQLSTRVSTQLCFHLQQCYFSRPRHSSLLRVFINDRKEERQVKSRQCYLPFLLSAIKASKNLIHNKLEMTRFRPQTSESKSKRPVKRVLMSPCKLNTADLSPLKVNKTSVLFLMPPIVVKLYFAA